MNVRLIAIAGPPSAGKTAVVKQIIRNLGAAKVAYLKIDVVQAWEDEELAVPQSLGFQQKRSTPAICAQITWVSW